MNLGWRRKNGPRKNPSKCDMDLDEGADPWNVIQRGLLFVCLLCRGGRRASITTRCLLLLCGSVFLSYLDPCWLLVVFIQDCPLMFSVISIWKFKQVGNIHFVDKTPPMLPTTCSFRVKMLTLEDCEGPRSRWAGAWGLTNSREQQKERRGADPTALANVGKQSITNTNPRKETTEKQWFSGAKTP